jgi:hypothetical protein
MGRRAEGGHDLWRVMLRGRRVLRAGHEPAGWRNSKNSAAGLVWVSKWPSGMRRPVKIAVATPLFAGGAWNGANPMAGLGKAPSRRQPPAGVNSSETACAIRGPHQKLMASSHSWLFPLTRSDQASIFMVTVCRWARQTIVRMTANPYSS